MHRLCWDYRANVSAVGGRLHVEVECYLDGGCRPSPIGGECGSMLLSGSFAEGSAGGGGGGGPEGLEGSYSYVRWTEEQLVARRGIWSPYPIYACAGGQEFEVEVGTRARTRGGRRCTLLDPGSELIVRPGRWRISDAGGEQRPRGWPTTAVVDVHAHGGAVPRALDSCYRSVACRPRRVGVSFSGGLDSSLLALLARRACGQEVSLYTATDAAGRGLEEARRAAEALGMGMELKAVVVRPEDIEGLLDFGEWMGEVEGGWSAMDAAIAMGFSAVARAMREDELEYALVGQLADELFGGYSKYMRARDGAELRSMMTRDLRASSRGLARDFSAFVRWGIAPLFPYTCNRLVSLSGMIPPEMKVGMGIRKRALRDAARELGLPKEIAAREKRAFQYSSGLERIAKAYGRWRSTPVRRG